MGRASHAHQGRLLPAKAHILRPQKSRGGSGCSAPKRWRHSAADASLRPSLAEHQEAGRCAPGTPRVTPIPPRPLSPGGKGERRVAAAKPGSPGPRCGHGRRVATARPRAHRGIIHAYVLNPAIACPQNPCDLGKIDESASFWGGIRLVNNGTIPVPPDGPAGQKKWPARVHQTRGRPGPNPA